MKKILNKLAIPFVILYIRYIQKQYKRVSIKNSLNQTNSVLAYLTLLQAKAQYYKSQFSPWGKYAPKFVYTFEAHRRHQKFMKWLFPEKDFDDLYIVLIRSEGALNVYKNILYKHNLDICERELQNEIKKRRNI